MRPKGFSAIIGALSLVVSLALPASAQTDRNSVLHLYLPGQFSGCSASAGPNSPAFGALLDMIRPSAFLPNSIGRMVGVGGPIASAELVSLKPQTVVYTINPKFHWSNGDEISINDLLLRIQAAKTSSASWSDGFRHLVSITEGAKHKTLRVVFDSHFADWPTMFRDLEHVNTPISCSLADVLRRPALGPYLLEALSPNEAVLKVNPEWSNATHMFQWVVVRAGTEATAIGSGTFVDYRYSFSTADMTASSTKTDRSAKLGSSARNLALVFSPTRSTTSNLAVRELLSTSIDRQSLINSLFGSLTYTLSPASSNLISQGQLNYPGSSGLSPVTQMTTTTLPSSALATLTATGDCLSCASALLNSGLGLTTSHGRVLFHGTALNIRLAVGPGEASQRAASIIQSDWRALGIQSYIITYRSDLEASQYVRGGDVDAAVITQTLGAAGINATSWSGRYRSDRVDAGWRSADVETAAILAESQFNPVDGMTYWNQIDQIISKEFWQRPLTATPYYLRWSSRLNGLTPSVNLDGITNEITLWTAS